MNMINLNKSLLNIEKCYEAEMNQPNLEYNETMIQLRPQAIPAFDLMPDSDPYPINYGTAGGSGGYGDSRLTRGLGHRSREFDITKRNRRFNPNNDHKNGKYLYQITLVRWFKKSSEKVRGRVYGLGQDRQRIKQFRVIEDVDSMFQLEMVVEIEYAEGGSAKQFEDLIKLSGANIKAV